MSTVTFPNGHDYTFQTDFFGATGYEYLETLPALCEDMILLAADVVSDADRAEGAVASVNLQQGYRNFIHNGGMRIDQKNEGAAVACTAAGSAVTTFAIDRWVNWLTATDGVITSQRSTDAPTGAAYSLKFTVTTPVTTLGSSNVSQCYQAIEGLDWGEMNFGTANASAWSCSFWAKSSIAGTYVATLANDSLARAYHMAFTITSANTWQQFTFNNNAGDTSGTWPVDNTGSARLWFHFATGTGLQNASSGAWVTSGLSGVTGMVSNWATTNGATFFISEVQLNKGTAAANFQNRPMAEELRLCERYYQKSFPFGTAPVQNGGVAGSIGFYSHVAAAIAGGTIFFRTPMRVAPTMTHYNPSAANNNFRDVTNSADRTRTTGTVSDRSYDISLASGSAAALNRIHYAGDAGM